MIATKKIAQFQFVGFAQLIGRGKLCNASTPELLKQFLRALFQFSCKIFNGIFCHVCPPFSRLILREPVFSRLHDQGIGCLLILRCKFHQFISGQVGQIITCMNSCFCKLGKQFLLVLIN